MPPKSQSTRFTATIRRAKDSALGLFALVPASVSGSSLRKGRVTARIALGSASFEAVMEPDGQLGHWFRIPASVAEDETIAAGDSAAFVLTTLAHQPEPNHPAAFRNLLEASESAQQTWRRSTALAKIDWVHWLESAKQAETREKRAIDAIDMLAHGKVRVCCFDPSGFYSKSLSAPEEAED